jgi:hypothetical protein
LREIVKKPGRGLKRQPALRFMRWVVTVEFVVFVCAIFAAVIGRAVS